MHNPTPVLEQGAEYSRQLCEFENRPWQDKAVSKDTVDNSFLHSSNHPIAYGSSSDNMVAYGLEYNAPEFGYLDSSDRSSAEHVLSLSDQNQRGVRRDENCCRTSLIHKESE